LKFTRQDFELAGYTEDGENLSDLCNAKLDEWLEAQTVVYICDQELKTLHFVEPVDATHKARLVCIEELRAKECQHEIKSSTVTLVSNGDTKFKCYKCGCELKATWGKV
jgi:hypothetical protein